MILKISSARSAGNLLVPLFTHDTENGGDFEMEQVFATAKDKMNKSVNALMEEYATIRVGRASASVLDKVTVDYYGAPTPVNQMAAVSVPEPRTLLITPWDKTTL